MPIEVDFLRSDITKQSDYDDKYNNVASSRTALKFFKSVYQNSTWNFIKSVDMKNDNLVEINDGVGFPLKSDSEFSNILGSNIVVTGNIDFEFKHFPEDVLDEYENFSDQKRLIEGWAWCNWRTNSYLNMSLIPMPKSGFSSKQTLPVFLYNLNMYFGYNGEQLFGQSKSETNILTKYLDNAFDWGTPPNLAFHIEDYCRKALLIEDRNLIRALLNYGAISKSRIKNNEPLYQNANDVNKYIDLVSWYWSEKENSILKLERNGAIKI